MQPPGHRSIRVRRGLRFLPLLGVIYCLSSAGPAGIEEIVPTSGPGLTLLLILLMPVFFGLPQKTGMRRIRRREAAV